MPAKRASEEPPGNLLNLLARLKGPKSYDERMAEAEEAVRERVLSYMSREELPFRRRLEYLRSWLDKTVKDLGEKKHDNERMEAERRQEADRLKNAAASDKISSKAR
jgi:hypothetical protein